MIVTFAQEVVLLPQFVVILYGWIAPKIPINFCEIFGRGEPWDEKQWLHYRMIRNLGWEYIRLVHFMHIMHRHVCECT